ncbi:MAG: PExPT-CTERM protein [Acidobacteriaceae bacterium]|jgi:XrtJ-associated TM-motif-TM protein
MDETFRILRNNVVRLALLAIAALLVPMAAHAQTGCTDSPENPTVVLALVGSAGALLSAGRRHLSRRRKQIDKHPG